MITIEPQNPKERTMNTWHYTYDRMERENHIREIGYGNVVKRVVVDRGHRNGPEIHEVTDTGIVNIYNQRTKKLVTKLIARPAQIKRYFTDEAVPAGLIEKARYNSYTLGYNY